MPFRSVQFVWYSAMGHQNCEASGYLDHIVSLRPHDSQHMVANVYMDLR